MKTPSTLILALLLVLPACKSADSTPSGAAPSNTSAAGASNHAQIANEIVALAEVTAVDPSTRKITLRREDGTDFRVTATDAVRNFAQIAVGDTLRVKYKETLGATRLPEGSSAKASGVALAAGRAKEGAKPAAGVGVAVSVCVKITSIDREHEVVVFSLPSGELIARKIATQEGRDFVKTLKLGDLVQLDYTEVLALTIEKL